MKLLAAFVFLFLLFPGFCQKTIWLDEEGNQTNKKNASYSCQVTLQKVPNAKTGKYEKRYVAEKRYLTGELYQTGAYSTKSLTKAEGDFVTYFKSGVKSSEVSYYHGLRSGPAIYYHANGAVSSRAQYVTGKADGIEECFYDDGARKSEVRYTKGKADGDCRWYFPNGQLASYEVYASDSLMSFELYNEDGTRDTLAKGTESTGEFPGGNEAMKRFLKNNLRYPQKALEEGIIGKVQVQFVVSEKGKISNVKVKTSTHEVFNDEAIRVVESMPDWKPYRMHGLPVNSVYNLPISFRLN